jgi:hypothetical protein
MTVIERIQGPNHEIKEFLKQQSNNRLVALQTTQQHRQSAAEFPLCYLLSEDRDDSTGKLRSVKIAFFEIHMRSHWERGSQNYRPFEISNRGQWVVAVIPAGMIQSMTERN